MDRALSRRTVLAGVAASLAGCAGLVPGDTGGSAPVTTTVDTTTSESDATTGAGSDATTQPTTTATPAPPAAATDPYLAYSAAELRSNFFRGAERGRIPAIDSPLFTDKRSVDGTFLLPGDIVFGLEYEGEARAYPQKILVHHEIVNDFLGDRRVAITYCPLTGTAMGFERGPVTFGVSGRLLNNNLVMYDRSTESLWPQMLATAVDGPLAGQPLQEFRLMWTTWGLWKEAHPDTFVLSRDTGYAKPYGRDPYGSYVTPSAYYFSDQLVFPPLHEDDRFERKRMFVCARTRAGAACFHQQKLLSEKVMSGEIGGEPVVAVYEPRYANGYVYRNPEQRSFEWEDGEVVGPEGRYAPADLPLETVPTTGAMWFAWVGFNPDTNVYA
jgi:hypothetical protein